MWQYIVGTLSTTLSQFFRGIMGLLPRLVAVLIIIVIGWVGAFILQWILKKVLAWVRFNALFRNTSLIPTLRKAALPPPDELLARLVFWGVGLGFTFLASSSLGIFGLQEEVSKIILFIPQLVVALLVLLLGLLLANFFGRATLLAAVNANYASPRFLSNVVQFLIVIFAATMALDQLGVGHRVVLIAFSISFGAVMLGLAIAFGLGGRDVARRILERQFPEKKKEEEDEISPL